MLHRRCDEELILCALRRLVLDADNDSCRPPDAFGRFHWVSGFENWNGLQSPITAVMGAAPDQSFSKLLLSAYIKSPAPELCSMPSTRWIPACSTTTA